MIKQSLGELRERLEKMKRNKDAVESGIRDSAAKQLTTKVSVYS